jgi:hypothetical protein
MEKCLVVALTESCEGKVKHHAEFARLAADVLQCLGDSAAAELADHHRIVVGVEDFGADSLPVFVDARSVDDELLRVAIGGFVFRDGSISKGWVLGINVTGIDAGESVSCCKLRSCCGMLST